MQRLINLILNKEINIIRIIWIFGSNILFMGIIYYSFADKIDVTFFINPQILGITAIIYIICALGVAKGAEKLFNLNIIKTFLNLVLMGTLALLGINIITAFRSIMNLIQYKDIIYEGRLFKIKYIYSKEELESLFDYFYTKNKGPYNLITQDIKEIIVNKSNTVKELNENILEFILEARNTPKGINIEILGISLSNLAKTLSNLYTTYPLITGIALFSILSLSGFISVKLYWRLSDNIHKEPINKRLETAVVKIDKIDESLQKNKEELIGLSQEVLKYSTENRNINISYGENIHKLFLVLRYITDWFENTPSDTEIKKVNRVLDILIAKTKRDTVAVESSKNKTLNFTGEGHRLGGNTTSREQSILLNPPNIKKDDEDNTEE